MNILIVVLVFIFIGGWFFLDSPSQQIQGQDIQSALTVTDLRSMAECTVHIHTEILSEREPSFQCTDKYGIDTVQICVDARNNVIKCAEDRYGNFPASYVITKSKVIDRSEIHETMSIIQELYPTVTNMGILMTDEDKQFLMVSNGSRREIPAPISKNAELTEGQLLYITKIPVQIPLVYNGTAQDVQLVCAPGEVKVIRYGDWQCVSANAALVCTGDMIWSADREECIIDPARRPLCASKQTAIQVDDHWECIDPLPDITCGAGTIARMDYTTMLWECVTDPGNTPAPTKCTPTGDGGNPVIGSTVRVPITSCTDCEEMITNPETCDTYCVPSPAKLNNPSCYRGMCTGTHRAFYFGFPNAAAYIENVRAAIPELAARSITIDGTHSQNRRFNCMDCGAGYIDNASSVYPYTAVCTTGP